MFRKMVAASSASDMHFRAPAHTTSGTIHIRELHATEERACEAFFRRLDRDDIHYRFGAPRSSGAYLLPRRKGADCSLAFAAVDGTQNILAIANVECLSTDAAEVALIVRSDLKRRGLGSAMLAHVVCWAEHSRVRRLTGFVLPDNTAMLRLASTMGFRCVGRDPTLIELSWCAGEPRHADVMRRY
ncbi:GNAT family N-acetyltransferase [Mesorhizobium sp. BAC0120]|uniref:GNAT family N-acetyltransferase n=1 Tax=Mesorhizobium sp. BAC0120 TaxID=3090670 RepID=UPI00298C4580|nr:GNAT family N-acetyltransferase [Mesorhizobium sp. BAC0120]MDW6022523.1 GNAT family N-acetyltransferase [Mesorhizobium sp. BAC0120]